MTKFLGRCQIGWEWGQEWVGVGGADDVARPAGTDPKRPDARLLRLDDPRDDLRVGGQEPDF